MPSTDAKTILKRALPAAPDKVSSPAASLIRAQKRGADVHPTGAGSRCRPPQGIAAERHPGSLLLPAPVHAGSRQTDARTAAKPDGSRRCRVRSSTHGLAARALPSLQPGGNRLASPSEMFLISAEGAGRGAGGRGGERRVEVCSGAKRGDLVTVGKNGCFIAGSL